MAAYEFTFGDYIRVVRRRKVWIVLCTFAGASVGFLYIQSKAPEYESAARVELTRDQFLEGQFVKVPRVSAIEATNLAEIVQSGPVLDMVVEILRRAGALDRLSLSEGEARGLAASVRLDPVGQKSSILAVTARTSRADVSAAIANAVADALVERGNIEVQVRKDRILGYLDTLVETYRGKVLELRRRIHMREAQKRQIRPDREAVARRGEGAEDLNARYWATQDEVTRLEEEAARLERFAAGDPSVPASAIPTLSADRAYAEAEEAFRRADAERARLLSVYTEQHPAVTAAEERTAAALEVRDAARAKAVRDARGLLRAALEEARAAHEEVAARIDEANVSLLQFSEEEAMREGEIDREAAIVSDLYESFRRQRDEIAVGMEFSRGDRIEKIEEAVPAITPVDRNQHLIQSSGLAIGFLVGIAAAFLRESLDTSITTIEDVERYIQKPVLVVVPPIRIDPGKVRAYLAERSPPEGDARTPVERADLLPTAVDPRAPSAEAYRALRTNLTYNFFAKGKKVLLITSATPQEGKTTTSSNLAVALASAGRRTILVGANVRHPNLGKFFPINRRIGFADIASGRLPLARAIQPSGVDNLWLLDSGGYLSRPADILQSDLMGGVLDSLRANFDAVLIDTPPVLPVTDAAILAPRCDGVVLIYYVSVAPREALFRAKVQLEAVGAEVIGIVLNDILSQARLEYGYYYYYHHRYAGAEERVRI